MINYNIVYNYAKQIIDDGFFLCFFIGEQRRSKDYSHVLIYFVPLFAFQIEGLQF